MDKLLILVYFEDNQSPFCQHVLEMTYFQRITFHSFRFQRNRSLAIPYTKLTLKKISCPVLSLLSSFPVFPYRFWEAGAISDSGSAGSELPASPLCPLCWAQTASKPSSEILICILIPDTHSFIKSKYSRQLTLHFFYSSNLLLTMKKMMSFPGCDKGLILYAVKTMSQQFLCPWGQSIQQFWK